MRYSDQFKAFREARGLTPKQLAARAGCHRNTVVNVESGRPVKFATIVRLMEKMGYDETSAETKLLALLWLEAITGIRVTGDEIPRLASHAKTERRALESLQSEVLQRSLEPGDIALLQWAARHRPILNSLRAIKDLVPDTKATSRE